ncbi:MAG: RIP metalloprotease RseP [Bryobacteraceae bacterium]
MVFFENFFSLLVLIGVMILVHELGHFWAARLCDVRVEVFSFGFGPRLFGFRRGDTDYRFSAILFGGYVKMFGEQVGDEHAAQPGSFLSKSKSERLFIVAAGPLMNILLSVGLLTGLFMVEYRRPAEPPVRGVIGYVAKGSAADQAGLRQGDRITGLDDLVNPSWEDIFVKEFSSAYKTLSVDYERGGQKFKTTVTPVLDDRLGVGHSGWSEKNEVEVGAIQPGLPADKAGLKKGDLLLSVNGAPIHSRIALRELIKGSGGKPVEVEYDRGGKVQKIVVQPVYQTVDGQSYWMIGVQPDNRIRFITTRLPLTQALAESVRQNGKGATMIVGFLKGIAERRMSAKQLQGPIGIATLSGDAAREGASAFIQLMSMVSLNLAIFNLLPIPILDGGVILLLLVEMVLRRDLSLAVKETVIKVGFVFLMVVTVFVLYNDITKLLPAGLILWR